jgi:(2Fe-2S) ferredoxin
MSSDPSVEHDLSKLKELLKELGIGQSRRHIFFCGSEGCCGKGALGQEAWDLLKKRLKELGLSEPRSMVFRTKVSCLRLCQQGPIALVYPEGIWYHHLSGDRLEKVIQEHLVAGRPVLEFAFSESPLLPTEPDLNA